MAASFLRAQGLRILRRNFCWGGRGELDIVARHGDILVACEVKSTISPASGAPARAINKKKRRHLRIGAYNWLRLLGYRVPVRLDIIEVYLQAREIPQLQWHQNAFPLDGKAQRDLFRSENPAPLSSEAGAGRVC